MSETPTHRGLVELLASRVAADLEAVFDVPVQVSAVLGRSKMDIGELLKLGFEIAQSSVAK